MEASFALAVMLSTGHARGDWLFLGDYDTEKQCETARDTAIEHWAVTHAPGYRVKFGAECIITLIPND